MDRIASLDKMPSGRWCVFYHTGTTPMTADNSGTFVHLFLANHAQVLWIEDGVMSCEDDPATENNLFGRTMDTGEAAPPLPFKAPNECPRCKVRGWIDSSPAWGTNCRCRACKQWFDGVILLPADPAKPAVRYDGKPLTADQKRVLKIIADAGPAGVSMGNLPGSDWRRIHALERAGLVDDLGRHRRRRITLTGRTALGTEAGPHEAGTPYPPTAPTP